MHLDEEQAQRLVHGELVPRVETGVREHLAACAECRAQVADCEREELEVHALLRHLDHAPPRIGAHAVARRAHARGFRWERWAAGIAVGLGLGAASYAFPGSPVPAWLKAATNQIGGGAERPSSAPAPPPTSVPTPTPAPDAGAAGIAVAPGRAFVISFTAARGQVRVSLTDGAEVVVRAPAGAAVFTSHVDRLVIDNTASTTTFDVQIPRAAPQVEIRASGQRIFWKEGSRITPAPSPGPVVLPLAPEK